MGKLKLKDPRVKAAIFMGVVVLGVLAVLYLTGCSTLAGPTKAAQNTEQKVYAAYGTVTIFAERGAALISDPTVPDELKKPVAQSIVAVKPPMDAALDGLQAVEKIKDEIAAGATSDDKLLIAASNLDRYYLELEPLVGKLVAAVTLAVKCRKFTGQELAACQGGGA